MTAQQAMLISLLLGRALDAILLDVQSMNNEDVENALVEERGKTEDLLRKMREENGG